VSLGGGGGGGGGWGGGGGVGGWGGGGGGRTIRIEVLKQNATVEKSGKSLAAVSGRGQHNRRQSRERDEKKKKPLSNKRKKKKKKKKKNRNVRKATVAFGKWEPRSIIWGKRRIPGRERDIMGGGFIGRSEDKKKEEKEKPRTSSSSVTGRKQTNKRVRK